MPGYLDRLLVGAPVTDKKEIAAHTVVDLAEVIAGHIYDGEVSSFNLRMGEGSTRVSYDVTFATEDSALLASEQGMNPTNRVYPPRVNRLLVGLDSACKEELSADELRNRIQKLLELFQR